MSSSKWIRKSINDLVRIRDSYEDRSQMYRMDRNERTWPISDLIIDEIVQRTNSDIFTNYTEIDKTYYILASYLDVKYDQLFFHSGSDLVIKSIFETYIDKDDSVLIPNPAYAMYGVYARMYGANLVKQDYEIDLVFDLERYCRRVEEIKPKMVVLENPSGYIGNSFLYDDVKRFIDVAYSCKSLVIVDEAYIDYIPNASVLDLISTYDNLIIVRTFSKAWGMAGLRAGYAVSNSLLISELFKVRPMHELTAFSALAVEVMLSHENDILTYVSDVIGVRNYFCEELEKLNIRFVKSDTHFVTACIGEKTNLETFRKKAHERAFYVRRPFSQALLRDWVRIGLLPMQDMQEFVAFLRKCVKGV